MTDTFSEGDLIEATKGDTSHRGRLERDPSTTAHLFIPNVDKSVSRLAEDGYTIRTIEKAAPALPAEPGHYLDPNGRHWLHQIHDGSTYGAPDRDTDQWLDPWGGVHQNPEAHAPFTRLEPVADTATKVLATLRKSAIPVTNGRDEDHLTIWRSTWDDVRAEFGVTS